jgi:hypothetical protein
VQYANFSRLVGGSNGTTTVFGDLTSGGNGTVTRVYAECDVYGPERQFCWVCWGAVGCCYVGVGGCCCVVYLGCVRRDCVVVFG